MKYLKKYQFGDVVGVKMGFSYIGKPFMDVFFYMAGKIMIDTGQSHMGKSLFDFLENKKIDRVILTHHHEDHSGNAADIKDRYNIPVYGNPLAVGKMENSYRILPYQHLMFGNTKPLKMESVPEIVEGEDIKLETISTPGHSKDHNIYYDKMKGAIFSGDLIIGEKIRYFRVDEDIDKTISSLGKVLKLDFNKIFCGHRPVLKKGKDLVKRKYDYLQNFRGKIEDLYYKGYPEKEIMKRIDIKESHTVKFITFGNVSLRNLVKSSLNSISKNKKI